MDEIPKHVGIFAGSKIYYADPHDMERAKRWGRLIHTEKGLAFYIWNNVTYVAPIDDPPMLQLLIGGKGS